MIPIRDVNRSEHFPLVNLAIIAVSILAFVWQMTQGPHLKEALFLYGIVPSRYSDPMFAVEFTTFQQLLPFLTSMFLHGGIMHILGNSGFSISSETISKTGSVTFDTLFSIFSVVSRPDSSIS